MGGKRHSQCSNFREVGVEPPYLTLPTPLPLVNIRPRGVEFQPPHLRFAEVGMLLYSHFLLMQFLKYLGQGSSISGPRAKSGPRGPNNWPAKQRQNVEEIYYIFFKIHFSVLKT